MNEMNTKVEIGSAPAAGTATIKSLMPDVADLANAAFVRVARVNLEVLGIVDESYDEIKRLILGGGAHGSEAD